MTDKTGRDTHSERLRALYYAGLAARTLPGCVIGPTIIDDDEMAAWERGLAGEPPPCGCVAVLREMEQDYADCGCSECVQQGEAIRIARAALGDTEAVE